MKHALTSCNSFVISVDIWGVGLRSGWARSPTSPKSFLHIPGLSHDGEDFPRARDQDRQGVRSARDSGAVTK